MKFKVNATFDSHRTKREGGQVLSFKIPYSDIAEGIKAIMVIQQGLSVGAQLEDDSRIALGRFVFEGLRIDRDGELTLQLATDVNASGVDSDVLRSIIKKSVVLAVRSKGDKEEENDG